MHYQQALVALYVGARVALCNVIILLSIILLSGCCDEKGLPAALKGIYSKQASERNKALLIISRCGAKAESAVPRIAALMYDQNVGVASSAAYALRKIDSKAAQAALKTAEEARASSRSR